LRWRCALTRRQRHAAPDRRGQPVARSRARATIADRHPTRCRTRHPCAPAATPAARPATATSTKTDGEGILSTFDTTIDTAFNQGAEAAKIAAMAWIKHETEAYKATHYQQNADWWRVDQHISAAVTRGGDAIIGMPPEDYAFFLITHVEQALNAAASLVAQIARLAVEVAQAKGEAASEDDHVDSKEQQIERLQSAECLHFKVIQAILS
jgi:hypothetical protein